MTTQATRLSSEGLLSGRTARICGIPEESMNEEHFSEIEATLLYISEARERAEKARKSLEKQGAETHLVDALRHSEASLRDLHRALMQGTYFAVPDAEEQMTLS